MKFTCCLIMYIGAMSAVLTSSINETDETVHHALLVPNLTSSTTSASNVTSGSTTISDFTQSNVEEDNRKSDVQPMTLQHKSETVSITSTHLPNNEHDLFTNSSLTETVIDLGRNQSSHIEEVHNAEKKHPILKPMVTNGGAEIDENKFNYMVPVAIAALAVPLIGATSYFLYMKIRDFWDKRHYRRMDFLIDGMYNE